MRIEIAFFSSLPLSKLPLFPVFLFQTSLSNRGVTFLQAVPWEGRPFCALLRLSQSFLRHFPHFLGSSLVYLVSYIF